MDESTQTDGESEEGAMSCVDGEGWDEGETENRLFQGAVPCFVLFETAFQEVKQTGVYETGRDETSTVAWLSSR